MDNEGKMSKDFRDDILREQIRLVIEQIPTMLVTSFIVALVLAYAVRNIVAPENILVWVLMVLLITFSRVVVYYRFRKVQEEPFDGENWRNLYLILAVISGIIWGASAFIIFPAGNLGLICLFVLVMACLSAGTTVSHSSLRLGPTAWAGPVMLLYAIRTLAEGGEFGYTLSFLIILYILTILRYSFIHNRSITSAITLRFENLELFAELRRVNDILRQDITKRMQAEEALQNSHSLLAATLESTADGILVVDAAGKVSSFNRRFLELWRIPETLMATRDDEQLLQFVLDQLVYPDAFMDKVRALYQTADASSMDELVFKDGRIFERYSQPQCIDHTIVGRVWSFRDITERKRAEEERRRLEDRLQRAEKMEALGTLAGGVAHDLNNVLGVVVGYSELLLNNSGESSSARSKAGQILKGGLRAAAIVQDLLTLARRGVSGRKVLNLNNIVLECRNSPEFAGIYSYHPNVQIKTYLEANLLNISGSAVHLSKSLMNLVSNAAEAMPEGGVITIKTVNQYLDKPVSGYDEVREGDYVVLSVSDTGQGIPAGDMKRIFEPFYTKKVMGRSGTGLGLAVIWGTVKDHLGYINVESEEGQGTIFTLYFPVTREEISPEQVSIAAAQYIGNGESILIVDDVEEQRELAGAMLKKLNYNVVSVPSGEEAVEYLKQNAVDLIVLDMIMDPGMDGLDTYAKILEIHTHQRAIIVSGFSETERVSRVQALGAGTYVKKPYVLEKLGLAVREELDRPA